MNMDKKWINSKNEFLGVAVQYELNSGYIQNMSYIFNRNNSVFHLCRSVAQ